MPAHRSSHGRRADFEAVLLSTPGAVSTRVATQTYGAYAVEQAVASGAAVRLLPGVVVAKAYVNHPRTRVHAAMLWAPSGSMLGGATAVAIHKGEQASGRVDVIVPPHARAVAPDWIDLRWLPPLPRWRRDGLVVVAAPHSVIDAWHRAPARERADVFYHALWCRVATAGEVVGAARDFARIRGRRHLLRMAELAASGATSPTEVIAKTRVFSSAEFSDFVWQARVAVPTGFRVIDMLHRGAKLAVELDGRAFHAGDQQWARDRERDSECAAAGILTMRLTYGDLRDRPEWCRAQVRSALAWRLPSDVSP